MSQFTVDKSAAAMVKIMITQVINAKFLSKLWQITSSGGEATVLLVWDMCIYSFIAITIISTLTQSASTR